MSFSSDLYKIERLIKDKKYDKAHNLANSFLISYKESKNEMWVAFYHQLAIISAKEKNWFDALYQSACLIHNIGGFGGRTRERNIKLWLHKLKKSEKLREYMTIAVRESPNDAKSLLENLINKEC